MAELPESQGSCWLALAHKSVSAMQALAGSLSLVTCRLGMAALQLPPADSSASRSVRRWRERPVASVEETGSATERSRGLKPVC